MFVESLTRWLYQFDQIEDRKVAYEFIMRNLIFISSEQLEHLVSISFSDKINPLLLREAGKRSGMRQHQVKKIAASRYYRELLRKSLFIGLSDGSRIDQLRRLSSLDNEQVLGTYHISSDKATDLITDLNNKCPDSKFEIVFLIDDFTGSGISYFRLNESSGKILKFLNQKRLGELIDWDHLELHILFYVATRQSINTPHHNLREWQASKHRDFLYTVDAVQVIEDDIRSLVLSDTKFISLAERYFDESIITSHYRKGKCDRPWLGFDECALPLILHHNTPNNSVVILWLPESGNHKGLFPRTNRHRDE